MDKFKDYLFIIDYGHGGLVNNVYQTKGKRSPKWDDKTFDNGEPYVLYEGVNNRVNGKLLIKKMESLGMNCIDLVSSEYDKSLTWRTDEANKIKGMSNFKCVYISIHSNAAGSGWNHASGISIHIHPKASRQTKIFADLLQTTMKPSFLPMTKWRGIKENDFHVLRKTTFPAVLLEVGFHDNKAETKLMLTPKWRQTFVDSVIEACKMYMA